MLVTYTPSLNTGPIGTALKPKCINWYYILNECIIPNEEFGNETVPADQHPCIVRLFSLIVIYIFNFPFSP